MVFDDENPHGSILEGEVESKVYRS
jgi:hypothetical protein